MSSKFWPVQFNHRPVRFSMPGFRAWWLLVTLILCGQMSITRAQTIQTLSNKAAASTETINLAGNWAFQIDSLDKGIQEKWFAKNLTGSIKLPGSMTSNGLGNDIKINTPWTGSIVDSSWFFKPEYAPYRVPGHIKVPFWLQPVKYYKGAAWYQKTVDIPAGWSGKHTELYIERAHWETTVWVDDQEIGMENSLSTAHVFDLSSVLTPGKHKVSVRVDNRVKDIHFGQNSHSISDHTQGNWNGMVGQLLLQAKAPVYIDNIQVFGDIHKKQARVLVTIVNKSQRKFNGHLLARADLLPANSSWQLKVVSNAKAAEIAIAADTGTTTQELIYSMKDNMKLWSEFTPNLYQLTVTLVDNGANGTGKTSSAKVGVSRSTALFGMREFVAKGTQFTINGQLTFLRGTLECAIFPKTGYPPTDIAAWLRIFKICRSYGLNHMRFHSWCPPEAAFEAADKMGFYLQIECASWANQDATIGDGDPLDQYIYAESNRIIRAYGNHPSFCMMAYGNEPAGKNHVQYLTDFVKYWKAKDSRRLYTTAAGWPIVAENDYNSTPDPRIQAWGGGLKSIINKDAPKADYNWSTIISKWQHPTVSHEIGQWCVYPDFKEIKEYDGVMRAKNFEIFQDKLHSNGMGQLADSFLLASGKLQALCYKADIEAALRTPGFGGFQLLDLHDFPGQGTALVGVLNPFWEDKGYITGKEYSAFCNSVVPLALLPKMVYLNSETLSVPVQIANFGASALKNVTPKWQLKDKSGKVLMKGQFEPQDIALGNAIAIGKIEQHLSSIKFPKQLTLAITVGEYTNSWQLFVYPASNPSINDAQILVTQQLDEAALNLLAKGGKVLLNLKQGSLKADKGGKIPIGFSSIFWNTAWTHGQPPHSLGILCNPAHPALNQFPTDYYSSWEWWDAMRHGSAIRLDKVDKNIQPIVRVIDDWVTARPLGLIFECRVGKGRLLVSGIDLTTDAASRPEARQLRYSLEKYMATDHFEPVVTVSSAKITSLYQ
ncbi:MAG TPA: hypothetical protein VL053_07815 [Arachidicoccus sp.]|nr:hypothetical protein [Arachidicoccus sp.]